MKVYNRGEKEYIHTVDVRETDTYENNVGYYETVQYVFADDEATTFMKLFKDKYKRLVFQNYPKKKNLLFFQNVIEGTENYGVKLNDEFLIAYIYSITPQETDYIKIRQVLMLYDYKEDVIIHGTDSRKIDIFNQNSDVKLVLDGEKSKYHIPKLKTKK